MLLLLDQLVYTSFPGVGFQTIVSPQIPVEIQEAFIKQVVYKYWDSLNPPKPGYLAAYLHQVSSEHILFGWVYNDGLDDLGRNHVPYFQCYYLAELLDATLLENIFTCLHRGPVALINRQSLPKTLETIVIQDLWSYQPARIGVNIPFNVRDRSYIALKQNKLLDLFIPIDEQEILTNINDLQTADFSSYTSYFVGTNKTSPENSIIDPAAIKARVFKPYQEYKDKLQRYTQAFVQEFQRESPISDNTRNKLKRFQQILELRDEDIARIEAQFTRHKQTDNLLEKLTRGNKKSVFVDENQINSFAETVPSRDKSRFQKAIFWSLFSLAIIFVVNGSLFATSKWNEPCSLKSDKRVWGTCYRDLQAKPLNIGIANSPPDEDYSSLATHLEKKLGSQVEIDNTPYLKITERIAGKEWDIAFTRSPIFSIIAEDNQYIGVTSMYPDQPPYYRAALYVRASSPIQSIADIKPTTTIALGRPESAPTFQLPIYALYGKSLRVGTGYRPRDVVEMVKAGKVDVGVNRHSVVKDDPSLRIIYVSKAVPGAGLYLSPKLSKQDREQIQDALVTAPTEIKASANYGDRSIPSYDELRKIIARTEAILGCPGFNIDSLDLTKTVNLFCKNQNQDPNAIVGQVREYNVPTAGNIQFKIVTNKNDVYLVLVSKQILNQIPLNPVDAVDKAVQLKNVNPQKLANKTFEVEITEPEQLSLLR